MNSSPTRRVFLLLAAFSAALGCSSPKGDLPPAQLKGMGATFPAPLYERWIHEHAAVYPQVKIEYIPTGSSRGVAAFIEESVDFGGTDQPLSDAEVATAAGTLHIPTTVGAVTLVFNVPGGPSELKLSAETIAAIYLGEVTKWNDGRITAENPGVALPDIPIKPVVRGDGSGTTKAFTRYLAAHVPAFKDKIGVGSQVKWITGFATTRNDGVADAVKKMAGAFGYTELAFARTYELSTVALENKAGKFVSPSLDSMTAAVTSVAANAPDDLRLTLVDPDGPDAYPLTALTFLLVDERPKDPAKAAALAKFLWWCVHEGQAYAPALHYATLPPELVKRIEVKINSIQTGSPKS